MFLVLLGLLLARLFLLQKLIVNGISRLSDKHLDFLLVLCHYRTQVGLVLNINKDLLKVAFFSYTPHNLIFSLHNLDSESLVDFGV